MSSITWQTFRDTDFTAMEDVAAMWANHIRSATEIETGVFEGNKVLKDDSGEYEGEAADAARSYFRRNVNQFIDDLGYAEKIKNHLYDAYDWFTSKQDELDDLFAEAGVDLTAMGGIGEEQFEPTTSQASDWHDTGYTSNAEQQAEMQRLRDRADACTETFRALIQEVRDYDDELKAKLKAINDDAPELSPKISEANYDERTADYLIEELEDKSGDPQAVNDWWNSLSEEEQALLVEDHPEIVGPMDGIPAEDRDTANRVLLDQEIDGLDSEIADLEAQLAEMEANGDHMDSPKPTDTDYRVGTDEYNELQDRLEELEGRRDSLNNLQDRISEPYEVADGETVPYYLLGIDNAEDGQAIVSVGNPDTADNVNVYVPGTGAGIDNAVNDLGRAEAMAEDAYEFGPEGSSTASIMWLDYDAPDDVAAATSEDYAADAASDLSSFTGGLRASAEEDAANLTMTGYSYGSTTIGIAARDEGLNADNMIFVGSPGVGVDTAADLGVDPGNVWASRNEEDVIGYARDVELRAQGGVISLALSEDQMVHGTDPTVDSFGGNTFTSEATRDGAMANHSAYWDEENDIGRRNMALILTDQTGGVS